MSYVPEAWQLRGTSLRTAECYGKPSLGCSYTGSGIGRYRLEDGARCAICGRPATNSHHQPPRSKGTFLLVTPAGAWRLRPALIALCGTGTMGCHGLVHNGGARIWWEWDSDESARDWWNGRLLEEYGPESPRLLDFGRWRYEWI